MAKLLVLILLIFGAGPKGAPNEVAPTLTPDEQFRNAWREFAAPVLIENADTTREQARIASIPKFEAAVEAAPDDCAYRTGLVYAHISAEQCVEAKEALVEAIERCNDNPLLYLLRAETEAGLAKMAPDTDKDAIGRAIRSCERAAALEPKNGLALLQAASIALNARDQQLALEKLDLALARPGLRLPRLPIPDNLDSNRTRAIRAWQFIQMKQWMDNLGRCRDVARNLLILGIEKKEAGDLDAAEQHFQRALRVARLVGNARPNNFISVSMALDLMEDAYLSLALLAEARQSPEIERWKGEAGVLFIGRQELHGALQHYMKVIQKEPPTSTDALLDLEARIIARIMRGVALSPTHDVLPIGSGKKDENQHGAAKQLEQSKSEGSKAEGVPGEERDAETSPAIPDDSDQ